MTEPAPLSPIRVVLVDDERLIRMGLSVIIGAQSDLLVVGEAAHGGDAVELVRELRPDVVLMDVNMAPMDGVEATRRILAEHATRIIMLTAFDFDERAAAAVRHGAEGFILKDADPEFILAAIRSVHVGRPVFAPQSLTSLVRKPPLPAPVAALSPGERDVLRGVAAGLSNAEIAAELFLSLSTVKARISTILRALDLRDRIQIVVYSHQNDVAARLGETGRQE